LLRCSVAAGVPRCCRSVKKPDRTPAEVSVRGWATEPDEDAQAHSIREYSDHALLDFEVLKH